MPRLATGPADVLLPASVLAQPLETLRHQVAERIYKGALMQLVSVGHPAADALAFRAIGCAMALLDPDHRVHAARRVGDFARFASLPINAEEGALILAAGYEMALRTGGLSLAQRREALKGAAGALMALAYRVATAPTIHHVELSPPLRSVGFPPLIDRLVFGLEEAGGDTADRTNGSSRSDATTAPRDRTTGDLIEAWVDSLGASDSEQSRHRSAAKLFAIAAGARGDDPARHFARLDHEVVAKFETLSTAVGSRWGTAPSEVADRSADDIIKIATTSPRPAWAQHPLARRGRKTRIAYAKKFLDYARATGVDVPKLDWNERKQGSGL